MACRTRDQIEHESVDPADVHGKRLAIVAWNKHSEVAGDVVVGQAAWDGTTLTLGRGNESPIAIPPEWLQRLKRVSSPLRDALQHAEFYIGITAAGQRLPLPRTVRNPT